MTQQSTRYGNGSSGAETPRSARLPRSARITAAIAAVLVAVHIFFTAVYNVPDEDLKYDVLPGRAADSYIRPYLLQDYRIFAPNPANSDRNLWVRGWVETPDGEMVTTKWVDTTAVELAEPYRRVLRKQLSVMAAESLMGDYRGLSAEQREVAAENFHRGDALYPLDEALREADSANAAAVGPFIRSSNFATSYASQVAQALWSEHGEVAAVQVRSVYSPIVRWEDRFDPDASAPASSYTDLGWRPVMEWGAQNQDAFARTFLTWAADAGVTTSLSDEDEDPGGSPDDSDDDDGGTEGVEE